MPAPICVTGSVSLVHATFARFLDEEMPGHPVLPAALAAWNKVLAMHQHLMLLGLSPRPGHRHGRLCGAGALPSGGCA
ncbi:MAG: hypothetical protein R2838_16300 [Caldilineaceae bacterium]